MSDHLKNGVSSFFHLNEALSHSEIIQTCVAYLLHLEKLDTVDDSTIRKFPLASYAAKHWMEHTHENWNYDPFISSLLDSLFSPQRNALVNWIRLEDPDRFGSRRGGKNYGKRSSDIASPLYYACSFGLQKVVKKLLIGGADPDVEGGRFGSPLQAASFKGHGIIICLLLERGANVNRLGGQYGTALQAAVWARRSEIIEVLLNHGADSNAGGGAYGNALHVASRMGTIAIVQHLLKNGADVNAQGGRYGSAIQGASYGGHHTVALLLLDHGADINAQGGQFKNALEAASCEGHQITVKMLLEHGANADVLSSTRFTAIASASAGGHNGIVQSPIKITANVAAQGAEVSRRAKLSGKQILEALPLDSGVATDDARSEREINKEKCDNDRSPETDVRELSEDEESDWHSAEEDSVPDPEQNNM